VLLARIRAQLRQHETSEDAVFTIGPYTFRPRSKLLLNPMGNKVRLTEKETSILRYLYRVGLDRVLFSVDYPYEQMDLAGRWFDDIRLDNHTKLKVGRENANRLFSLGPPSLSESLVAGFAS